MTNRQPLQQVRELPEVPRPGVGLEPCDQLLLQEGRPGSQPPCDPLQLLLGEQHHVAATFAQRRHAKLNHFQSIEEIRPEAALAHRRRQVAVARRQDPRLHGEGARAPDALELPVFEHPEELRLELQGQLAELVEQESSLRRQLEAACPPAARSGEGAPLVAEELALDQAGRERGAVDVNEGTGAARGALVDDPGDQPLARSGLAGEQHRRAHRRNRLDLLPEPPGRRARSSDPADGLALSHRSR
jgi:hypothetical protein